MLPGPSPSRGLASKPAYLELVEGHARVVLPARMVRQAHHERAFDAKVTLEATPPSRGKVSVAVILPTLILPHEGGGSFPNAGFGIIT